MLAQTAPRFRCTVSAKNTAIAALTPKPARVFQSSRRLASEISSPCAGASVGTGSSEVRSKRPLDDGRWMMDDGVGRGWGLPLKPILRKLGTQRLSSVVHRL